MRRPTALFVALQLALVPACKKDEPAADATAAASDEAKSDPTKPTTGTPTTSPAVDITTPSYPAPLDGLLDLVPASVTSYMVVRDPGALVNAGAWWMEAERAALERTMAIMARRNPGKEYPEFRTFLDNYGAFVSALAGGVQLDRGAVVFEQDDAGVVLFHAADPDALKKALALLGVEAKASFECKAVAETADVVACSEKPAVLAAFAPGKAATQRRADLAKAMPGTDLERANLIGIAGEGDRIAWTIETTPGLLQLGVQLSGAPAEARQFAASGPASALEVIPAGATFIWGRVDMAALAPMIASVPSPFQNVVKSLSGEYLLGTTENPSGILVLAGATDPAPFRGAVALMMLGLGEGAKPLPDGGSVDLKLENLEAGGATMQVLHATVKDRPEVAQLTEVGMVPEAFAFAGGRWIAGTIGADAKIVDKIVALAGAGPSDAMLASLPGGLASGLRDGKVAFAIHLALDGLHAPSVRSSFEKAMAAVPKEAGVTVDDVLTMLALLAPLSSMSAWMTWNDVGPQAHFAVQGFSDPATDSGKAAQAALIDVGKGGDPSAVYGALAKQFPDAPRALSYRIRGGELPGAMTSSMSSVFLIGMLAAIAIPAFTKYIERSKAAGGK